jgi:hypothetical protein
MKHSRKIVLTGLALALALAAIVCAVFFAVSGRVPARIPDPRMPISLRPLKPGESAPVVIGIPFRDTPEIETVFIITNHTANTVIAHIDAVEVKSGSNWITQLRPTSSLPLRFAATNSIRMPEGTNSFVPGLTTFELLPHQSAYSTIQFSGRPVANDPDRGQSRGPGMNCLSDQPTGMVWRLTLSVQEKLTGVSDLAARVRHYPRTSSALAAAGVTNALTAPFSSTASYFGKPVMVSSGEARFEEE